MNDLANLISVEKQKNEVLVTDKEQAENILENQLNNNKFNIPYSIRETLIYKNNAISYRSLDENNRMMN